MKNDLDVPRLSRVPRLVLSPVAVRRYSIPNHGRVVARLWRLSSPTETALNGSKIAYAIELHGLGARRLRLLPGDEAHARNILSLLARNTVTPCGLQDVLEEL